MRLYLIDRLEQFTKLSDEDRETLASLSAMNVRNFEKGEDIICEGEKPEKVNLILDGWCCRYKVLEDGRRQIAAFLLPGDLCDVRMFILKKMDHSIGAISSVRVAQIPKDAIISLLNNRPRLTRALWWSALVEESIQREWAVNLGQRDAVERLAHLFCELFVRLRIVGLTEEYSYELPTTQAELGDVTGLSVVHVNRTIHDLRAKNLIAIKGRRLTIPDMGRLQELGMFNANYLHLSGEGQELDANHVRT